jgi:UDPglucose--hexose-1-phosphate uridylyltransferase
MIELRKDYVLDRWSYIAAGRGKRPNEMAGTTSGTDSSGCYFCPGNEHLTPPEIGRVADGESWRLRWFPNKFPAVEPVFSGTLSHDRPFHILREGSGYHEVIAETPDHGKQLAGLGKEEIGLLLRTYRDRIAALSRQEGIRYVQVFKNSGAQAGTSIAHSHSQIIAGTLIPPRVQEKLAAAKGYDKCPYCDIVKEEEKSERLICSNAGFVAFTTFAPRFNFEAMIFPKRHYCSLEELEEEAFDELAEVFQKVLAPLGKANAPYNFYLHYAPQGEDLHFHFEITPRLNTWAGFELATGSCVITASPEEAAAFYRE